MKNKIAEFKLSEFNRQNLLPLRERFNNALQAVAAEYGIRLEVKGGSFTSSRYTFRVEATCRVGFDKGPSDSIDAKAQRARDQFGHHCQSFGLKPEHFGHAFILRGQQFRICGLKPQSPKFPVLAARTGGKGTVYKFRVEDTGLVSAEDAKLMEECRAEARWEMRGERRAEARGEAKAQRSRLDH